MGLALLSFIAIFMLVSSAGLLLFYRADMMRRLSAVISPSDNGSWLSRLKMKDAGSSLGAVVQPFDKVLPKSPKEVSLTEKRLIRAGFRESGHVRILFGSKVVLPIWLCILVAISGVGYYVSPFFAYASAAVIGYLAPDFWLSNRIKKRQMNVRLGLPELLDLLVVCIEAGLSLDQGLARSVQELGRSQPEISDEFGLVLLEQRAGRPRLDAWRHLAERVDIDIIRTLVSAIVQAEQFGTSISKTLRVYSDTLRVQRRQSVEEMAAKTSVKLVFPLVLFILPSLFIVTLGPAFITIGESFQTLFK
jgi:tight adherence protein C